MWLILRMALAAPCEYGDVTLVDTEHLAVPEAAYDDDPNTWATGSRLELGLDLPSDPVVEEMGVVVSNPDWISYHLLLSYSPSGEQVQIVVADITGDLRAGERDGWWEVGAESDQLQWVMDIQGSEAVGFQILCEASSTTDTGLRSAYQRGCGCGLIGMTQSFPLMLAVGCLISGGRSNCSLACYLKGGRYSHLWTEQIQ